MSARTLPVTPAPTSTERCLASVLRAILAWNTSEEEDGSGKDVLHETIDLMVSYGFLWSDASPTDTTSDLLARVEAEDTDYQRGRRDERAAVNRELRTGDVDAANVKIDDLEALVAELRGKLAGSAPPAKEPR